MYDHIRNRNFFNYKSLPLLLHSPFQRGARRCHAKLAFHFLSSPKQGTYSRPRAADFFNDHDSCSSSIYRSSSPSTEIVNNHTETNLTNNTESIPLDTHNPIHNNVTQITHNWDLLRIASHNI